jgi:dTDP-4-dehydrorhamnose reductase
MALRLDIGDRPATMAAVAAVRPDLVIHTAISRRPEDFDRVIVAGSDHVAQAAAVAGARLIHLSTDILFDGTAVRYDETDLPCPEPEPGQPDPLSPHGRAKARAELRVRASHPAPVIVRTSLIYGFHPPDHSTTWLIAGIRRGEPVVLFTDQIRRPIYVFDLAQALIELAGLDFTGVIHLVGPTALSRYEFGLLLCRAFDLPTTLIRPEPTPADVVAPRRLDLSDDRAQQLLRTRRRSPDEVCRPGVAAMLNETW